MGILTPIFITFYARAKTKDSNHATADPKG